MSEHDYHGLKTLLSQVAFGSLSALTSRSDSIVNQVNLGAVVTTENGEAGVAAFGSVLNISQYKAVAGMLSFRSFIADLAKKLPKSANLINQMLSSDSYYTTGLLLKERLVNFPPELAPNLHHVMIEDAKWSVSDEFEPDEGEKRESYDFKYVLALCAFEIESGSRTMTEEGGEAPVDMGHKRKRKFDKRNADASRIFLHWEDEIFIERALFSHSWQNTSKPIVCRANKKYNSYFCLYALRYTDYVELSSGLSQVQ